uniref:Uncharacterized protein n=1 Tax=viral metagenome TaxID=1070528 RepID=A0A6C0CKY7_9ZZZZ
MGQAHKSKDHEFKSDFEYVQHWREKNKFWWLVFGLGFLIPYIIMYLVVNPVGTYYYTRLPSKDLKEKGVKGGALATVILGWLGLPFLNFYSPVAYIAQT